MIYVTGSSGLIGTEFLKRNCKKVKTISYREDPEDLFESHDQSCLIHLAWSSTTRNTYDDIEKVFKSDVINSKKIFEYYSKKNPNGRIIFISSAGGIYVNHNKTVSETSTINPNTLYGECKVQVENILNSICCETISLRVSNVWGGKNLPKNRVNGLVDKLLSILNTDEVVDLYTNLDTRIDIIHVSDLISLIEKCISLQLYKTHEMFVVGSQSLTIKEVLDVVCRSGSLNIKLTTNHIKNYLHVENSRVRTMCDWSPIIKLV